MLYWEHGGWWNQVRWQSTRSILVTWWKRRVMETNAKETNGISARRDLNTEDLVLVYRMISFVLWSGIYYQWSIGGFTFLELCLVKSVKIRVLILVTIKITLSYNNITILYLIPSKQQSAFQPHPKIINSVAWMMIWCNVVC